QRRILTLRSAWKCLRKASVDGDDVSRRIAKALTRQQGGEVGHGIRRNERDAQGVATAVRLQLFLHGDATHRGALLDEPQEQRRLDLVGIDGVDSNAVMA